VFNIVDSLKANLFSEMPRHIERWKYETGGQLLGDPPIPDMETWKSRVEIMRTFAEKRPLFVRRHIIFHFGLSGASKISVNVVQPNSGKIFINDVAITEKTFQGLYFNDDPIRVKAVANPGYEFDSWQGLYNGTESEFVSTPLSNDTLITAIFRSTEESVVSSRITENTTLTKTNSPYIALADVVIDSGVTLQIEPGVEIRMQHKGNILVYGGMQMNGTKSDPILIKPNTTSKVSLWGAFYYNQDNESVVLINEIHYNPAKGDEYEFIEIINNGNSQVDLTDYLFTEGIDFTFPAGTTINAGEYIVISKNEGNYNDLNCQVFL